jgi:hypothetical protein
MKSTTTKSEVLHRYGFINTPVTYYAEFTDVRKKPPEIIWPDYIYRGDEIVSVTGQFIPTGDRARFVGMFGEELTIHCEHDTQTYKEVCDEFDQLPDQIH